MQLLPGLKQKEKEVCTSEKLLPIAMRITQLVANWLFATQNSTASVERCPTHFSTARLMLSSHNSSTSVSRLPSVQLWKEKNRTRRKFICQTICLSSTHWQLVSHLGFKGPGTS